MGNIHSLKALRKYFYLCLCFLFVLFITFDLSDQ